MILQKINLAKYFKVGIRAHFTLQYTHITRATKEQQAKILNDGLLNQYPLNSKNLTQELQRKYKKSEIQQLFSSMTFKKNKSVHKFSINNYLVNKKQFSSQKSQGLSQFEEDQSLFCNLFAFDNNQTSTILNTPLQKLHKIYNTIDADLENKQQLLEALIHSDEKNPYNVVNELIIVLQSFAQANRRQMLETNCVKVIRQFNKKILTILLEQKQQLSDVEEVDYNKEDIDYDQLPDEAQVKDLENQVKRNQINKDGNYNVIVNPNVKGNTTSLLPNNLNINFIFYYLETVKQWLIAKLQSEEVLSQAQKQIRQFLWSRQLSGISYLINQTISQLMKGYVQQQRQQLRENFSFDKKIRSICLLPYMSHEQALRYIDRLQEQKLVMYFKQSQLVRIMYDILQNEIPLKNDKFVYQIQITKSYQEMSSVNNLYVKSKFIRYVRKFMVCFHETQFYAFLRKVYLKYKYFSFRTFIRIVHILKTQADDLHCEFNKIISKHNFNNLLSVVTSKNYSIENVRFEEFLELFFSINQITSPGETLYRQMYNYLKEYTEKHQLTPNQKQKLVDLFQIVVIEAKPIYNYGELENTNKQFTFKTIKLINILFDILLPEYPHIIIRGKQFIFDYLNENRDLKFIASTLKSSGIAANSQSITLTKVKEKIQKFSTALLVLLEKYNSQKQLNFYQNYELLETISIILRKQIFGNIKQIELVNLQKDLQDFLAERDSNIKNQKLMNLVRQFESAEFQTKLQEIFSNSHLKNQKQIILNQYKKINPKKLQENRSDPFSHKETQNGKKEMNDKSKTMEILLSFSKKTQKELIIQQTMLQLLKRCKQQKALQNRVGSQKNSIYKCLYKLFENFNFYFYRRESFKELNQIHEQVCLYIQDFTSILFRDMQNKLQQNEKWQEEQRKGVYNLKLKSLSYDKNLLLFFGEILKLTEKDRPNNQKYLKYVKQNLTLIFNYINKVALSSLKSIQKHNIFSILRLLKKLQHMLYTNDKVLLLEFDIKAFVYLYQNLSMFTIYHGQKTKFYFPVRTKSDRFMELILQFIDRKEKFKSCKNKKSLIMIQIILAQLIRKRYLNVSQNHLKRTEHARILLTVMQVFQETENITMDLKKVINQTQFPQNVLEEFPIEVIENFSEINGSISKFLQENNINLTSPKKLKHLTYEQLKNELHNSSKIYEMLLRIQFELPFQIPQPKLSASKNTKMMYILEKIYQKLKKSTNYQVPRRLPNSQRGFPSELLSSTQNYVSLNQQQVNLRNEIEYIKREKLISYTQHHKIKENKLPTYFKFQSWKINEKIYKEDQIDSIYIDEKLGQNIYKNVILALLGYVEKVKQVAEQFHSHLPINYAATDLQMDFIPYGCAARVNYPGQPNNNVLLISASAQNYKILYICTHIMRVRGQNAFIVTQKSRQSDIKQFLQNTLRKTQLIQQQAEQSIEKQLQAQLQQRTEQ